MNCRKCGEDMKTYRSGWGREGTMNKETRHECQCGHIHFEDRIQRKGLEVIAKELEIINLKHENNKLGREIYHETNPHVLASHRSKYHMNENKIKELQNENE